MLNLESEKKRERIAGLILAGLPLKEISKILNIPISTVKKFSAKFHKTDNVDRVIDSGRSKKLVNG